MDSESFSSRCCAFRRTQTSADPIRLLCIRLALLLALSLPSRFVLSARLVLGGTPCALRLVGNFSCGCIFWEKRGGRLIRQPVGTATMTAVMSANHVDLGRFSSRCCTVRHTHTSAYPIQLLCIRLASTLTLFLPSWLAPSARLRGGVPPWALWLAGIFLRRKKRYAGIVGTRTDWVLKEEEGGMTTPLLQYVARFDGGGQDCWVWRGWCSLFDGFPSLFIAPSGEQLALPVCWRGTSPSTISRVFGPMSFSGQSVVVDVEGVGFWPRAVVVGREAVAVCTRISSQEYV